MDELREELPMNRRLFFAAAAVAPSVYVGLHAGDKRRESLRMATEALRRFDAARATAQWREFDAVIQRVVDSLKKIAASAPAALASVQALKPEPPSAPAVRVKASTELHSIYQVKALGIEWRDK